MPETFGSGVPFAPQDGRPAIMGRFHVPAGGIASHGPFPGGGTVVLTSMDIVSAGGGSGGIAIFYIAGFTTTKFMAINIGSNVDAFSWRGAIPLGSSESWEVVDTGDTSIDVVLSGMWVPIENFAV